MVLFKNKYDIKIVEGNKNIFQFELSSKPNVDVLGITVCMWKDMPLKLFSLITMLLTCNIPLERYLGLEIEHILGG